MLLNDGAICKLISSGAIEHADNKNVGPASYDLNTKCFYLSDGEEKKSVLLNPGDSVFVGSSEIISVPNDIACRVVLRNSRIREGLSLDAPLYLPGHKTRVYFRVTNVSAERIRLGSDKGIAAIVFERLESPADSPYEGAFSDEFNFTGMASYSDVYAHEVEKVEGAVEDLRSVEKRLYANVITILSILVGAFALINVNFGAVSKDFSALSLIVVNLCAVGGISAMFGLLSVILHRKPESSKVGLSVVVPFSISIAAFFFSIAVSICI